MKALQTLALGLLAVAVCGCGGGGGGSTAVAPQPEVGGTNVRLAGVMTNEIASSAPGGLAVFGFTGAITKAYWTDATPTAEEGEIVVGTRTPRGSELVAMDMDGTNQRSILALTAPADKVAVSPDGVWLYFVENYVLKRVPMAGGSPTTLLNDVFEFCLTPSGSKILVHRPAAATLSVINANGSGLVDRNLNVGVQTDIIGAVTETYAYVVVNKNSSDPEIRGISLSGPTAYDNFYTMTNTSYIDSVLDWKRENIYIRTYNGATAHQIWIVSRLTGQGGFLQTLSDNVDAVVPFRSMGFLPDNVRILANESAADEFNIALIDNRLNVLNRVTSVTSYVAQVAFAPAPTFRTLVGAGNYASGAALAMFSEKSNRTPAVVLADCATRASMTLTRVSDDNDGTLIYRLECDNLTKLHFTRSNSFTQVSVIGGIVGLKGAFVAFNADTGRVSNVVTFSKKPTVSKKAGKWIVEGDGIVDHLDGSGTRKPASMRVTLN